MILSQFNNPNGVSARRFPQPAIWLSLSCPVSIRPLCQSALGSRTGVVKKTPVCHIGCDRLRHMSHRYKGDWSAKNGIKPRLRRCDRSKERQNANSGRSDSSTSASTLRLRGRICCDVSLVSDMPNSREAIHHTWQRLPSALSLSGAKAANENHRVFSQIIHHIISVLRRP